MSPIVTLRKEVPVSRTASLRKGALPHRTVRRKEDGIYIIMEPRVENKYNMTSTSQQYPAPKNGGRIPNINDPGLGFRARDGRPYVDAAPIFGETNRRDLVGHQHTGTPLNTVFFSQANLDTIQESIRAQVYMMSGNKFQIDRQSDDEVKLIMRSYYLSFAQHNPLTIAEDLASLNARVVGYASAKVYSEVDFHMFYLKDLEQFAPPIANPTNVHLFGTRTGELKSFF